MPYLMTGLARRFTLSLEAWGSLLALAEASGWKPEGTKAPPSMLIDWDGSYNAVAGQRVSDDDALALGVAIDTIWPEVADMPDPPHGLDAKTVERFAGPIR